MSTDRELLELAARAYWGDQIDDECSVRWLEVDQAIGYTHADNQDHNGADCERVWNPLTNDGDALRLAVKLNMSLGVNPATVARVVRGDVSVDEWFDANNDDPYAATRRAIVRAAAELERKS